MIRNTATSLDRPTAQDQARRDTREESAFKPVALPALAAAVRAARTQQPHRPIRHELPAILRKEAQVG